MLRRKGCPLQVTSADGKTVYTEGRDFEPVADTKLGQVPFAGEFEFEHEGPPLRLTPRSRIKDGETLLLSWYHPILTHGSQIMCCLSEPKVETILRDQARRVNELFHPKTFFMSHDEIRFANWCRACQDRKLTPGKMLAENVRRCVAILKQINPRARIVVWSDMFDPNHNAVDQYYLVNGSLKGSWEGLSRDVIIANWNSGKAAESLSWFAVAGPSPDHRRLLRRLRPLRTSEVEIRRPAHRGRLRLHVHDLASEVRPAGTVRRSAAKVAVTRQDCSLGRVPLTRCVPTWRHSRRENDIVLALLRRFRKPLFQLHFSRPASRHGGFVLSTSKTPRSSFLSLPSPVLRPTSSIRPPAPPPQNWVRSSPRRSSPSDVSPICTYS